MYSKVYFGLLFFFVFVFTKYHVGYNYNYIAHDLFPKMEILSRSNFEI